MSAMNVNAVLSQIRAMSSQIQAPGSPGIGGVNLGSGIGGLKGAGGPSEASSPFAALMKQGVQQVNEAQRSAETLATAFERGVPGVELPQVMLEAQKASVSFKALTEVRNRFVSVYQDIMNMPI
ncbi:MAG TPA: flagellar hook-basal body complex protein FliE [Steroidobacteraceae bacterium]|nr:flagellar hook-basal body complex protein FliE [Steroidobacteraceae bacterium]